jgi:hypothetical protein
VAQAKGSPCAGVSRRHRVPALSSRGRSSGGKTSRCARACPCRASRDDEAVSRTRQSSQRGAAVSDEHTTRPVPYSLLPFPQKSSRLVAAVAGKSRHVAGKSRACGGLLRCFPIFSSAQRSFSRRKNRIVGGCFCIYVRRSGGDVHNAPGGCRTAEICRLFD